MADAIPRVVPIDMDRNKRIMEWLDNQPPAFRAVVHERGLVNALRLYQKIVPAEVIHGQ